MLNKTIALILDLPFIGASVYRILHYLDDRSDRKAKVVLLAAQTRSVQVITKSLLYEALTKIKRGIKADLSLEGLKSGAINNVEVSHYAKGNREKEAKLLEKAYVYHGSDIKNELDRARMANKRVEDYRQKQEHVLKLDLIRKIRKEKNPNIKIKLETEFRKKYL